MKRLLFSASIAAATLAAPLACDLEKITAEKVVVGTLLSTPAVDISPTAALGADGGVSSPDGGDATITIPAQTAAFVFFGTREGEGTAAPSPIANATVTLQPQGGQAVGLPSEGAGTYGRTSNGEGTELKYQEGATYDFIMESGGEKFVGRVKDAPKQEKVEALHPASGVRVQPANQAFSFTRRALAANEERTVGFVSVIPVGSNGNKGTTTYTNMPSTPLDFLKLVALPSEWKSDTVTIPATAFPQRDSTYLVVFQTVRMGGAESSNLWFGSALLAGTADIGVVQTQP
ncbi:hypothetical protein P2318_22195 [Myxococcaceae bacterium GXIMD 01537]